MTSPGRARSAGFSLLEIVVALAVMAVALVIVYRAMGGGARAISDTSRYTRAIALAESVLELRRAVPATGWNQSGDWEIFRWTVLSTPLDAAADSRVHLHRVQVRVTWTDGGKERSFALVSLRPEEVAAGKR